VRGGVLACFPTGATRHPRKFVSGSLSALRCFGVYWCFSLYFVLQDRESGGSNGRSGSPQIWQSLPSGVVQPLSLFPFGRRRQFGRRTGAFRKAWGGIPEGWLNGTGGITYGRSVGRIRPTAVRRQRSMRMLRDYPTGKGFTSMAGSSTVLVAGSQVTHRIVTGIVRYQDFHP